MVGRDVGQVLAGRYCLVEPLGRGGMGRVYRAHDQLLDRDVALKLLFEDATGDRELQRACATEARVASRVTHPGVARVLDSGVDDGRCFVVSELIEGRTLAMMLRDDGPLKLGRALDLAIELADALTAVHALGIVHCDVKPSNIIVADDGHARLVDFGIARSATMTTGLTDEALRGSAEYVAPEQVQGGHLDGRVDLYALGVVLYELIAGQTPFNGGTLVSVVARRLVVEPPALSEHAAHVPPGLDLVVRRALARHPDERYQTASELRNALQGIQTALAATETAPVPALGPVLTGLAPLSQRLIRVTRSSARRSGAAIGLARGRLVSALDGPWRHALGEHGAYLKSPRVWAAGTVPVLALLVAGSLSIGAGQVSSLADVEAEPATEPALVASITTVPTSVPSTATWQPPTATLEQAPLAAEPETLEQATAVPPTAVVLTSVRTAPAPPIAAPPPDVPPTEVPATDVPATSQPTAPAVAPSLPIQLAPAVNQPAPPSNQTVPIAPTTVPAPVPQQSIDPTVVPTSSSHTGPSQKPAPASKVEPTATAPAPTQPPATQPAPTQPAPTQPPPTRQPVTEPAPKPPPAPKPSQHSSDPVQSAAPSNESSKAKEKDAEKVKAKDLDNGSSGQSSGKSH
jgi:serine/threonine-protein kinase